MSVMVEAAAGIRPLVGNLLRPQLSKGIQTGDRIKFCPHPEYHSLTGNKLYANMP